MSAVPAAAERANALPVYLDNQASTPLDPRVLEAMMPYFTIDYGNPHSESHVYGHRAMGAKKERAQRRMVCRLCPCGQAEVCIRRGLRR